MMARMGRRSAAAVCCFVVLGGGEAGRAGEGCYVAHCCGNGCKVGDGVLQVLCAVRIGDDRLVMYVCREIGR